jgi:hypothetical protein
MLTGTRYFTLSMMLLISGYAFAQWSNPTTPFHVTAVHSKQVDGYCQPGTCFAFRITVDGYTEIKNASVTYVLECDEVIQDHPAKHHNSLMCVHLHASNVYPAYVNPTTISFWTKESMPSGYSVAVAYDIKSENEVSKGEKN